MGKVMKKFSIYVDVDTLLATQYLNLKMHLFCTFHLYSLRENKSKNDELGGVRQGCKKKSKSS